MSRGGRSGRSTDGSATHRHTRAGMAGARARWTTTANHVQPLAGRRHHGMKVAEEHVVSSHAILPAPAKHAEPVRGAGGGGSVRERVRRRTRRPATHKPCGTSTGLPAAGTTGRGSGLRGGRQWQHACEGQVLWCAPRGEVRPRGHNLRLPVAARGFCALLLRQADVMGPSHGQPRHGVPAPGTRSEHERGGATLRHSSPAPLLRVQRQQVAVQRALIGAVGGCLPPKHPQLLPHQHARVPGARPRLVPAAAQRAPRAHALEVEDGCVVHAVTDRRASAARAATAAA